MKTKSLNSVLKISISLLASVICLNANDIDAKTIIDTKCTTCHTITDSGLSRISEQRKTPEGWWMTVSRMEKANGLVISDDEKKKVVKYLSDTQGLNPKESDSYRYILEQLPNIQEAEHDKLFTEMCNRCHSAARIGLQRRTKAEWSNLVEFHMGYFPSIEYHSLARDREWYDIAKTQIVDYLDTNFGNKEKFVMNNSNYSGEWILYGHKLAEGDYIGNLKLSLISDDKYKVEFSGKYLNGKEMKGSGEAIVYSGYEYRASLNIDGLDVKQVFKLDPKNSTLFGVVYDSNHPEESTKIEGVKTSNKEISILGVYPSAIKAGTSNTITIVGNNLSKNVKLSDGLKINKIVEQSSNKLVLDVTASSKYDVKEIDFTINSKKFEKEFTVYKKIDALSVTPSYAISRVGDGGGPMPKQHAIFEAFGILAGADKKVGTADDINIGKVDAKWSIEPFNERAVEDEDVKYVGVIDSSSGRFTPSFAGPNPLRKYSTNNAGNIKVVATYKDGNKTLTADSHMIVTVQKWVNPPIN